MESRFQSSSANWLDSVQFQFWSLAILPILCAKEEEDVTNWPVHLCRQKNVSLWLDNTSFTGQQHSVSCSCLGSFSYSCLVSFSYSCLGSFSWLPLLAPSPGSLCWLLLLVARPPPTPTAPVVLTSSGVTSLPSDVVNMQTVYTADCDP